MNNLVPVDQIKGETFFYFWQLGSGDYECKSLPFFKADIRYMMTNAQNVFNNTNKDRFKFHNIIHALKFDNIPELVKPIITEVDEKDVRDCRKYRDLMKMALKYHTGLMKDKKIGGKKIADLKESQMKTVIKQEEMYNLMTQVKVFKCVFRPQLIAYLQHILDANKSDIPDIDLGKFSWETKHLYMHIVSFLSLLQSKNGIDFDVYINNWAKRIMTDMGL